VELWQEEMGTLGSACLAVLHLLCGCGANNKINWVEMAHGLHPVPKLQSGLCCENLTEAEDKTTIS